jgi:hypothetical protein
VELALVSLAARVATGSCSARNVAIARASSGREEVPMTHEATPPAAGTELDQSRRQTVGRFFQAIQAGDYPVLLEVLTPDAITRWPQSGELMTGAMSCVRVYQNYPGGPPTYQVQRISGGGEVWVAELVADYGADHWYTVSILEFEGPRIARMTDYYGQDFPAPDWRKEWVQRETAAT